jgi:hypothetical protein
VRFWLAQRDIEATDAVVRAVFQAAKQTDTLLTDAQILAAVASASA